METGQESKKVNREAQGVRPEYPPEREENKYSDVFKGFGSCPGACSSGGRALSDLDLQHHPQVRFRISNGEKADLTWTGPERVISPAFLIPCGSEKDFMHDINTL
jgi:hypothetical protein